MTSITFSGRIPAPQMCFVGMKGEHNAEVIAFAGLPALGEGQTEILNLMLPDGTADAIEIIDGQITLTRDHTPQPGTLIAWAEIHVGTAIVWKSEKIRLIIDTLPDADGEIEKQYPTAFEQAIAQTGANVVAAETAQEAAETAQGKAEDAQDKAEDARDDALDAKTDAVAAKLAAEAAQGAAETAQTKAETAQTKSETAQGKAETAQSKAEDAQGYAETAQDKAEDARDDAVTARDQAVAARDQVFGMTAQAQTLQPGSQATASYSQGVLSLGIPRGADGQDGAPGADGVSPTISVSEITGGHRVTATDAQGDHTFDVMDGDPGDPTELIDDTAGSGDTDKVWSADKSAGEVSDLLSAISGIEGSIAPVEASAIATAAHAVGELFVLNDTLLVALSAIAVGDTITTEGNSPNAAVTKLSEKLIKDVQINGTSVVTDGVANVPIASTGSLLGVSKYTPQQFTVDNTGKVGLQNITDNEYKASYSGWGKGIRPNSINVLTFYGLAKAAGSDEKNSTLSVGQYTDAAKSAIHTMLNAPVTVTGTTPTITALAGIQYICGEVSTLDITLPASGCIDVVFESGSTPTVLTITPPTGVTVKWANGFDPTSLEANTTYEINICNGLGVAASWT